MPAVNVKIAALLNLPSITPPYRARLRGAHRHFSTQPCRAVRDLLRQATSRQSNSSLTDLRGQCRARDSLLRARVSSLSNTNLKNTSGSNSARCRLRYRNNGPCPDRGLRSRDRCPASRNRDLCPASKCSSDNSASKRNRRPDRPCPRAAGRSARRQANRISARCPASRRSVRCPASRRSV